MRKEERPTQQYNWTNYQKLPHHALPVCLLCLILHACDLPSSNINDGGLGTPSLEFQEIQFSDVLHEAPLGDWPAEPYYAVVDSVADPHKINVKLPEVILAKFQADMDETEGFYAIAYGGPKPTSGYSIAIERVYLEDGILFIWVNEMEPNPEQILEEAHTLPLHVVSIPKGNIDMQVVNIIKFVNDEGEEIAVSEIQPP